MSFEDHTGVIDYYPCTYGRSRVTFRGPAVHLDNPYTAVIGGSEVYGKYAEDPFTDLLAERTGRSVVNLGLMNAGPDVFALDENLLAVIVRAQVVVVQAMGALNLSNRYYTVHSRRNDRFLEATPLLTRLYWEVDFSDFSFTRHLVTTLKRKCPRRFKLIQEELSMAWVARMKLLLSRIPGQRVLLLIEDHADHGLGVEPLFVTIDMIRQLEGSFDKIVQIDASEEEEERLANLVYPETDRAGASRMISAQVHGRIAESLARVIRRANGLAA